MDLFSVVFYISLTMINFAFFLGGNPWSGIPVFLCLAGAALRLSVIRQQEKNQREMEIVRLERTALWGRNGFVGIGDLTCVYNAHSDFLRCTPNPRGPCQECKFFETKEQKN